MKIALVLNDDFSMWHFRGGLMKRLVGEGHAVYAITPAGSYVKKMEGIGVTHISIPVGRFIDPMQDILLCIRLYLIFRKEKFDIVHTMTIKPNIYGTIAARMAGIKRIVGLVSGLGFMFSRDPGIILRICRPFIMGIYRFACKLSDRVWFQNEDDMRFFIERRVIAKDKAILIKSGGINLYEYSPGTVSYEKLNILRDELGISKTGVTVIMVTARMIWSKGVREYIKAAEILLARYPETKFILVGPLDERSPDAVPAEYLRAKGRNPNIKIISEFRDDVKEMIALSDIVVLPSYYKEGVPRVLLEALAMAKPVVTTDTPGCSETVECGKNGYLIPIKDADALAKALGSFLGDSSILEGFGRYSRIKAEKEFNEKAVIGDIIKNLYNCG